MPPGWKRVLGGLNPRRRESEPDPPGAATGPSETYALSPDGPKSRLPGFPPGQETLSSVFCAEGAERARYTQREFCPINGEAAEEKMRYHLFVIGEPYTDAWWTRNLAMGVNTAGFENAIGDRGHIYLHDMDTGDWVIAYAKGSGAVGAGVVDGKDTYRRLSVRDLPSGFESRHQQFRSVTWEHYVERLADAVPFRELRLGFAPRNTKTEFTDQKNARRIIRLLAAKSNGTSSPPTPKRPILNHRREFRARFTELCGIP
jgi:hypothetical protein